MTPTRWTRYAACPACGVAPGVVCQGTRHDREPRTWAMYVPHKSRPQLPPTTETLAFVADFAQATAEQAAARALDRQLAADRGVMMAAFYDAHDYTYADLARLTGLSTVRIAQLVGLGHLIARLPPEDPA